MKHIKDGIYRGLKYSLSIFSESLNFYASYDNSGCALNGDGKTAEEAINNFKEKVDAFLATAPKDIHSLATELEKCLIWTGYEDCYMDAELMEVQIRNFITANPTWLKGE